MNICLASASLRRLELLRTLGHCVRVIDPKCFEISESNTSLSAIALINARRKAEQVYTKHGLEDSDFILGADTIISFENQIFGKPRDTDHAKAMLAKFSGHTHDVITGFCIIGPKNKSREAHVVSKVTFRSLCSNEIQAYVKSGESLDKAGAYGIQGSGAALIDHINGSITNIIGLPIAEVFHEAKLIACPQA